MKAWSAGEFVGTGRTGQVRRSWGKSRSKDLKSVRMKRTSKLGLEVHCMKPSAQEEYRVYTE